jgi:hypothetical protein
MITESELETEPCKSNNKFAARHTDWVKVSTRLSALAVAKAVRIKPIERSHSA